MMSNEILCHTDLEVQSRIAEYRGKFPEISEEVLVKILQEHGSDIESCQNILEAESKKCLYGSSPTLDIPAPLKIQISPGARPQITIPVSTRPNNATPSTTTPSGGAIHGSPTGSSGSGQSSGRSTPINQKPTPYVVPKFNQQTGQPLTPNHYHSPSGGLPPGMVYSNGGYFYTATHGAGHHVSPTTMPTNQTSPNTGYPVISTSGYFSTSTGNITTPNTNDRHPPPMMYPPPGDHGVPSVSPQHSTMPNQPLPQRYMYYGPMNPQMFGHGNSPQMNNRFQTLPANLPLSYGHGGVFVPVSSGAGLRPSVPNLPTTGGFIPIHSMADLQIHDHIFTSTPIADYSSQSNTPGNNSPYAVDMNTMQLGPRFSTFPSGVDHGPQNIPYPSTPGLETQSTELPYQTNTGFAPINPASPAGLNMAGPEKPQFTTKSEGVPADDEYLKACLLFQQNKRFLNLQKEYDIEKERLEILIRDISDRDHELFDRRYRVAPDPTDDEVKRLAQEINKLKRTIDEISKNIDRLDNGQGFLPPANPQVNPQHRIVGQRPTDKYDRSKSAPCLHDQGASKPSLTRPLSEIAPLQMDFDNNTVQYHLTPPSDSSLQEWSLINQNNPAPDQNQDVHNDEGAQWSCPQCTFLNHGSLCTCEMCNYERS